MHRYGYAFVCKLCDALDVERLESLRGREAFDVFYRLWPNALYLIKRVPRLKWTMLHSKVQNRIRKHTQGARHHYGYAFVC